ncbi:hypothetical protein MMC17_001666 [Xylographa soralifera]|nr:hypothetical protein [Xylographa soralifera]
MSSIKDLSQELLELILQELYGEGQPLLPLKNVNLTCRALHGLATSLLFQHVILVLASSLTARCANILTFLENQATVRSHVRNITIPFPVLVNNRALQTSLRKILPLLPRLQAIRLGGDAFMAFESMQSALLSTIEGLGTQPSLDVDCYVPGVTWSTLPDRIRCLRSLRVRMGGYYSTPLAPSSPSDSIVKLISQNSALHHLHLFMDKSLIDVVEKYPMERTYALERIGPSVRQLHSLTLEGDFHFTDKAWIAWATVLFWKQIQTLTIAKLSLIEDFASRCTAGLPALHTLKLSAYSPGYRLPKIDSLPATASISNFLASLQLDCLSLEGFHPDILLDGLKSTLRYVRFHIRESASEVKMVGGSDLSTLHLSTKHIETIRSACPNVYWLGLDAEADILNSLDSSATVAATSASPTTSGAQAKYLSLSSHNLSSPPPTLQHDQSRLPDVLDMLATIRSLCHIRLFFYGEPVCKAMFIFTYLRTRKQGFPLRSLVIRTRTCVWIIWELGSELATLEYHGDRIHFREVWDTVNMAVRSWEPLSPEAWIGHPIWGCAEGW